MQKKKYLWAAVIIWALIIFSWSLQSGGDSGRISGSLTKQILAFLSSLGLDFSYDAAHHFIRKAAHFSEYAVLGLLVFNAQKKAPLMKSDALCIVLWMAAVPFLDETIQRFVPERAGMASDMFLDMCGFLTAVVLCLFFTSKRKR